MNAAPCAFDLIYTCRPLDLVKGVEVGRYRYRIGQLLGKELENHLPKGIDYVVPVPDSGLFYAMGLSESCSVPYLQALVKKDSELRTLSQKSPELREKLLTDNITPIPGLLKSKNIILVDEAIFTGTTLKIVCSKLREEGVGDIYICLPTSPRISYCDYLPQKDILSQKIDINSMKSYFGVRDIFYLDPEVFKHETIEAGAYCTDCFTVNN